MTQSRMILPTSIISNIINFLDISCDIHIALQICKITSLSHNEKKQIYTNWYNNSNIYIYHNGNYMAPPKNTFKSLTNPPFIILPGEYFVVINKEIRHYRDGYLHNDHGPAIIAPNYIVYYSNGKKHRIDGPSVTNFHVNRYTYLYHLNGKRYSYTTHLLQRIKNKLLSYI